MATKLYGCLRSRASRPDWLLRELGAEYERVPVLQAGRAKPGEMSTASAEFLAINPNGLIPSLEDDGFVLHESLAMNLYLAKKHGGPLAPRDLREDALMTMWSLWAGATVEPHAINVVYYGPKGSKGHDARIYGDAVAGLRNPMAVLDSALAAGGGHLVGGRFTVADVNVAEVTRYAQGAPELFEGRANLSAWIAACQSRPAFKAMMEERNAEAA
ncbi:glutathione S-transferase family protein [Roseomonas sp. CCTCC AB2023176]|uniref:glutathione S-transferase family protein n=1 Tax=Roseomonas sp. CCTCC AB2023176 TaxID=3342640 RepID=UPI0035DBFC6A